ncbi:hypothetical protein D3C77_387010 [compost metagenome]
MARGPATLPLILHFGFKALPIYGQALLCCKIFGQIKREAISIIHFEGICSTDNRTPFRLGLLADFGQNGKPIAQRLMESLFLCANDLLDKFALCNNIAIVAAHNIANRFNEVIHERSVEAQRFSIADSPAQQTADNISTAFIGRQHAVSNSKGNRTDMVGNNLHGYIAIFVCPIWNAGDLSRVIHDWHKQIRVKIGIHVLQNGSKPLQSCSGINIFVR